jgi:hypothetical protein
LSITATPGDDVLSFRPLHARVENSGGRRIQDCRAPEFAVQKKPSDAGRHADRDKEERSELEYRQQDRAAAGKGDLDVRDFASD